MQKILRFTCLTLCVVNFGTLSRAAETKPLKALLIAGGCCHDYAKQKDILKQGIEARANVQVDIIYSEEHSSWMTTS